MAEPAKDIPDFSESDIDKALHRAMTPEEQNRFVETTFHIDAHTMDELDKVYPGIRDAALYPSDRPAEYENALLDLLGRIKEIKEANIAAKTMPYEIPLLPKRLPVNAFEILYPDFKKVLEKTDAEILEALKEVTAEEGMKRRKETRESLKKFFDEEEARLKEEDKNIGKVQKKVKRGSSDVLTSAPEL